MIDLSLHDGLYDRSRALDALPPSPVPRLPLQESPNGTEIALVPEKVGLLASLGPETDGIRQCVHRLSVPANERTAEVDALQPMLLSMQVGDLPNVVGHGVQQRSRDVLGREAAGRVLLLRDALDMLLFATALEVAVAAVLCVAFGCALLLVYLAEGRSDVCALQADLVVRLP
jgi:hypothetical protein